MGSRAVERQTTSPDVEAPSGESIQEESKTVKGVTVFKDWTYFTANKAYADESGTYAATVPENTVCSVPDASSTETVAA